MRAAATICARRSAFRSGLMRGMTRFLSERGSVKLISDQLFHGRHILAAVFGCAKVDQQTKAFLCQIRRNLFWSESERPGLTVSAQGSSQAQNARRHETAIQNVGMHIGEDNTGSEARVCREKIEYRFDRPAIEIV